MMMKNTVKIEYTDEKYGGGEIQVIETEYYRGMFGSQRRKTTVLYKCDVRIGDDAVVFLDAIRDRFTLTHGNDGYLIFDGFGACSARLNSIKKALNELRAGPLTPPHPLR